MSKHNNRTLWYQQPAAYWEEALPVGNGRLGAMFFGGVKRERIQFNEETLFSGKPMEPDRQAYWELPRIRELLKAKDYEGAQRHTETGLLGIPFRPDQMGKGSAEHRRHRADDDHAQRITARESKRLVARAERAQQRRHENGRRERE